MAFSKDKLLKLRDDADRLLKKMEQEEKDRYEKLALSFTNTGKTIDQILSNLKTDKSDDKLSLALSGIKTELAQAVKAVSVDLSPLLNEIRSLSASLKAKQGFNDQGIIMTLNRIEKVLDKKESVKTTDNSDKIIKAIKGLKVELPELEFPTTVSVDNFPPTKTPMPVTHISINALNGFIHTTAQTVSSTLATLPAYGVLDNRRTLQVYNNSSTVTVFIGGSDVTATNGLPVPPKSYSPAIDASPQTVLYGLTSSSTANVRVLEISDEESGR